MTRKRETARAGTRAADENETTHGALASTLSVLHPRDFVKLRREDYKAYWQARRRLLLAQAEAYSQWYTQRRGEGNREP